MDYDKIMGYDCKYMMVNKYRRMVMNDIICGLNDRFCACINDKRFDDALKLEKEILSLVGTNNRIVNISNDVDPKIIFVFLLNRTLFYLCKDELKKAAYSMIDLGDAIYNSGLQESIYNILNALASQRGRLEDFSNLYEVACINFMIGILCRRRFPAMSLSFMWKARASFEKLKKKDLALFVKSYIDIQNHRVYCQYNKLDPQGVIVFKEETKKTKQKRFKDDVWELSEFSENLSNKQLSKEEKKLIYGESNCKVMTSRDVEPFLDHILKFEQKDSVLFKIKDSFDINKCSELPNILELLEYVCYDEEKYAIKFNKDRALIVLYGEAHKRDGEINQIVNNDDEYIFISNGIINNVFYRGQTKHNNKICYPSLYRNLTEKEVFIERVKRCELYNLLQKLPSVNMFRSGLCQELPNDKKEYHKLFIDYDGLAQHYGIKTNYLDLTVDKWVAAFFACCDYVSCDDSQRDIYKQHVNDDVGIFYIYINKPDYTPDGKLRSICFQPQARPVLQSGYVLSMDENEDFADSALGIPFKYNSMCSNILYGMFGNSYKIQPAEIIELKAKRIVRENRRFSSDAYKMAHEKFYDTITYDEFMAKAEEYGLEQQKDPIADFTKEEIKKAYKDMVIMNNYLYHQVKSYSVLEFEFDD